MSVPSLTSPLYQEADIGPFHWPPAENAGSVVVDLETEIEVETPKANGKDPSAAKVKGKKIVPVTLSFRWIRAAADAGNAIRLALDPHGVNSGKPFTIVNPEANARGVDHVLIKKASKLTIQGDHYSFTLTADGWKEPPKASVGGTQTPAKAVPASAKINMGTDLPIGPTMPLGEFEDPLGLKGPNKPNAEP